MYLLWPLATTAQAKPLSTLTSLSTLARQSLPKCRAYFPANKAFGGDIASLNFYILRYIFTIVPRRFKEDYDISGAPSPRRRRGLIFAASPARISRRRHF